MKNFNWSVEAIISKYDSFYTYNVHKICPDNDEYFYESKSSLSDLGFCAMWRVLDDAVRKIDSKNLKNIKDMMKEDYQREKRERHPDCTNGFRDRRSTSTSRNH